MSTITEFNIVSGKTTVTNFTDVENSKIQASMSPTYQDLRAASYPPITDYLDGIVKGDAEQVAKYIADCLAVKAQFPKG